MKTRGEGRHFFNFSHNQLDTYAFIIKRFKKTIVETISYRYHPHNFHREGSKPSNKKILLPYPYRTPTVPALPIGAANQCLPCAPPVVPLLLQLFRQNTLSAPPTHPPLPPHPSLRPHPARLNDALWLQQPCQRLRLQFWRMLLQSADGGGRRGARSRTPCALRRRPALHVSRRR